MREQLDLRQSDIQSGRKYERASMKIVADQMLQKGKMTQEQVQEFFALMEESNQRQEKKE